ncbi:MAG: hypothetical protein H6887_18705 [Hoeflea sp.]|nr:hypothetical protein [Hoeflea sp.]
MFGPLALFWVVLGILPLRGLELQVMLRPYKKAASGGAEKLVDNNASLLRHVRRDQIELDRETILHQREQYLREINPVFIVSRNGGHAIGFGRMFRVSILNKGEIASDVDISIMSEELYPNVFQFPSIARGESKNIEMTRSGNGQCLNKYKIFVRCSKRNGDAFEEEYLI